MQEISLKEAKGKKIVNYAVSPYINQLLLFFDDGCFTVIGIEGGVDAEFDFYDQLEWTEFGDITLVEIGMITQKEMENLRKQENEKFKKQREENERRMYERLKRKFEGESNE